MGQSLNNENEDGTNTDESAALGGTDNGQGDDGNDGKDIRVKELSDEAARRRIENKQLKTALDEALGKLKSIEDKDKSEVERATSHAAELEAKLAELATALEQERIQKAFLASNKYTWHNPERALALVDLADVTIGEDGTVTGLDKALEKLAKSDSYLIKDSADDAGGSTPTGTPAGSGTKQDKGAVSREKLMAKYPALRR